MCVPVNFVWLVASSLVVNPIRKHAHRVLSGVSLPYLNKSSLKRSVFVCYVVVCVWLCDMK